jgi:hypothetical protein
VNEQLEKLGHNIGQSISIILTMFCCLQGVLIFLGVRLIDEFLAKSGVTNCSNFKETADVISKIAFKMFLGISPDVTNWNKENTCFSLLLVDNPFIDFVELPPEYQELSYCSILCGIIKGALEMVQLAVDCKISRDILKGDDITELKVELKGMMKNTMADEYKEK